MTRIAVGVAVSAMLLAALLLPNRPAEADAGGWTSNGPAGDAGAVAVAPSDNRIVYAIGQQRLWKSADGGNSWAVAGGTLLDPDAPLAVDPRDPATIYSDGRPSRGIVKSADGGASWAELRPSSGPAARVTALAIHPTRPGIIYAGVARGGTVEILRSVDGGANWVTGHGPVNVSPGLPSVAGFASDPSHPDVVYAALQLYHGGVVLRSTDAGATWTALTNSGVVPLTVPLSLAVAPGSGAFGRLYVTWGLMGFKALFASDDGGAVWQDLTAPLPSGGSTIPSLIIPELASESTLIASVAGVNPQTQARGGVYISLDGGQSWRPLPVLAEGAVRLAWAPATRTLYAATGNGVWRITVPHPIAAPFRAYYDTHDGVRVLGSPIGGGALEGRYFAQYFEKGRIEDHTGESADPNWQFMYGLLADELQQAAVNLPVGGDNSSVTYRTIKGQAAEVLRVAPPRGFTGGTALQPDGSVFVPFTTDLSPAAGHNVASRFWAYVNRTVLFPGGWLHDIGLPITEPMAAVVDKGAAKGRQITIQAFQRTILTDDPLNPPEWRVERANVGTDYRLAFPAGAPGTPY